MAEIDYSLHYRRWHDNSDKEFLEYAKMYERLLGSHLSHLSRDATVLDYGCGSGLLVNYLLQKFKNTIGIDASKQQVDVAQTRCLPVHLLPVNEFHAWCRNRHGQFDVIFLMDVLEHIIVDDQIDFLSQLQDLLKPGGCLFIKVPNANSLLASRWRYLDWTHKNAFTESSLDFVCLNASLDQPIYFDDDSSIKPNYPWLPRWGLRNYYFKQLFRFIWKAYLWSELGPQSKEIRVGYNLLAKTTKLPDDH